MGHRIENYSLNELHRIAVPGAVAPSLFWVLPMGNWQPRHLDNVWRWFTERPSECHDYGLLLVKTGQNQSEGSEVSLGSVGAKLSDVMPTGAERFISPSAFREDCPKVLVLSGGYPQPGWGVLVEWPKGADSFEGLIRESNAQLTSQPQFGDGLQVFANATSSFHRWRNLRVVPTRPNVSLSDQAILDLEEADSALNEARRALELKQYRLLGEKLIEAIRRLEKTSGLAISRPHSQTLRDAQQALTMADSILAIPSETLATEIQPRLTSLVAEPSKREAAFKELKTVELKHALSACLNLREKSIGTKDDFRSWAQRTLVDASLTLSTELERIVRDIATELTRCRGELAQLLREHELAMDIWRRNSGQARDSFHRSAERATELQWHLGPQFLVAFEDICRERGLWVRSIPWDPARMVGWKIMARHVKLESLDLEFAARELSPSVADDIPASHHPTGLADGSYFTDYVHHIAISKPGFSPRTVTCDLIARVLRAGEMTALLEQQGVQVPDGADSSRLADTLLESFGWRACDEVPETPLAGCIRTDADGVVTLLPGMSGNDLRIVLESFCKDLLDLVVAKLGYKHDEIWSAIRERVPEYRPASKQKDWDDEVKHITAGAASMLLASLGSLAFAAQENEVKACSVGLKKLSDLLNQASHHRSGQRPQDQNDGIAALIVEVLERAQEFLGELPWHLQASYVYGEQPKVISGEAWSHGSPAPRLLRVILWTGATIGPRVLLWNKTRRNPIVTDPLFVERPRRR